MYSPRVVMRGCLPPGVPYLMTRLRARATSSCERDGARPGAGIFVLA